MLCCQSNAFSTPNQCRRTTNNQTTLSCQSSFEMWKPKRPVSALERKQQSKRCVFNPLCCCGALCAAPRSLTQLSPHSLLLRQIKNDLRAESGDLTVWNSGIQMLRQPFQCVSGVRLSPPFLFILALLSQVLNQAFALRTTFCVNEKRNLRWHTCSLKSFEQNVAAFLHFFKQKVNHLLTMPPYYLVRDHGQDSGGAMCDMIL